MNTKAIQYQNPFLQYLFAVVLLLTIFNFSGFSIAPVQVKTDSQQTGRLGNTQRKPIKSLSYKSALNQLNHLKYQSSFLATDPNYLAAYHTLLFNLVFTAHNKPNLSTQQNILSYQTTITVSKNDDDDLKC
ncbi:hypothetical protein FBD94_08170 [Pedobacter hiemivivus]|uniref:Uncharacterized protein n=1 Tax=Pedobacter hiemivivus TaxID=2530454 RepID=A0A4U1GDR4_9SPHI|nr:hypothetical protein [Pedobacter hiemivivus]TKC62187.1 hypothetical protein FBD94_08170 [Pedobacter hiemivivus]